MKDAIAAAFTVVKSTVELYKIRSTGSSGCYWADITIDASGGKGRISIASDFGSWQNYWGAAGSDFKAFLAQINEGYAAEKFGAEPRIDVEASIKEWRRSIIYRRQQEQITAECARDIWDELEGLGLYAHNEIEREVSSTIYLDDFLREYADYDYFEHEPDPKFVRFWKEIWPVLLAEFAREAAALTIQEGKSA